MDATPLKKIWTYLGLTLLLSSPFYYLIISSGEVGGGGGLYVLGVMWGPGLAGLLTRLIYQRNVRGMGWGWGKTRYQLAAYLIPVAAGLVVYGIVWTTGLGRFSSAGFHLFLGSDSQVEGALAFPLALAVMATAGVLLSGLTALGEEIGWRGLLVPEMAKVMSFTKVSFISAAVWSVYHYPALFFADYSSAAPTWYAFIMFTLSILGVSFMANWLRLRSGSLWTAVILHASHNLFIQNVFDGLTADTGSTQYITTEFGAGLTLVYLGCGYWCWRHRGDLPPNPRGP